MKRILSLFICCMLFTACSFTDDASLVTSNTDTMAYLAEKNRVYWIINENPNILQNIIYSEVDWFSEWKDKPEQRRKLIDETIRLYQNKKGE